LVDPGESEIGEGKAPEARHGIVGRKHAGTDIVEKLA
jgi:hypothetical protein